MSEIRAYLRPTGLYSRAFLRVANALERYKPDNVSIATNQSNCDFQLLHVISYDAIEYAIRLRSRGIKYAVIQYCLGTTERPDHSEWYRLWQGAELVWSYYDLSEDSEDACFNFYHAPLGVDDVFIEHSTSQPRRNRVITTGYVSGPDAEPIEEVWIAANLAGMEAIHVGPEVVKGIDNYPANWRVTAPSDRDLAELYSTSRWVSGMRHVEGFELPAAEGLICGCRSIVFDQPTMRRWYGDRVEYVAECRGEELIDRLRTIFEGDHKVARENGAQAVGVFDWKSICDGFWSIIGNNRS